MNPRKNRAGEFLTTFAKLEDTITRYAQSLPDKYYDKGKKPATVDASLRAFKYYRAARGRDAKNRVKNESEFRPILENVEKMSLYNKLRNALAHNFDDPPIADPRQGALDGINKLYADITHPRTAQQIMIKNVQCASPKDDLYSMLEVMSKKGYTNIPVIENEKIIAILSERTALRWVAATKDIDVKLNEYKKVWDIENFLDDINDRSTDLYEFIPKNLDAYSINDMFSEAMQSGKRISALFVTNSGSYSDKLLGIITAWDLHTIE